LYDAFKKYGSIRHSIRPLIYNLQYNNYLLSRVKSIKSTNYNGILYDLGAHIIDQTIVLFGSPLTVSGETYTQREGSSIDDAFDIRLNYGKLKVTLKSN
jgi:predicted dehydrogenase